jgi:hypothetical protein
MFIGYGNISNDDELDSSRVLAGRLQMTPMATITKLKQPISEQQIIVK